MKIIAVISAFLSIVTGAGIYINTNTSSDIRTSENVSVTAVCETEKTAPAVTETKKPQTEKEAEVTAAETVTEVQITVQTEAEECKTENTETAEPAVTEKETAEIPEVTVSENETSVYYEYQVVYKELLNKLRFETDDISEIDYTIHDMNNDNIPELITITGTCEADKTTTFYTIKDHEAVVVGKGFRGDHSVFYIDERTDRIAVRSDWSCTGYIATYDFDGEKITVANSLSYYDTMDDPEGYEEEIEKMFDLKFYGYGFAFADGSSNLLTIDGDSIELNYDSYFFTD